MIDRHLQMVMAETGYYNGGIDGDIGPKSWAAIQTIETEFAESYTFNPRGSTASRRKTAALQACLNKLHHNPGAIDGWHGVNTTEAMNSFLYKKVNGRPEVVDRARLNTSITTNASRSIPLQKDVASFYGNPGSQIKSRLATIELPFTLRIDWNLRQKISKIRVHEACSAQLKAALIAVHEHYGPDQMRRLGIDRFAGSYNHRKMRGGNQWSMHAYGCAVDFYAGPNGLRTKCPQALFCGAEYKDFLDIMEQHEWLPAVRLWGKDAMHFQRARL